MKIPFYSSLALHVSTVFSHANTVRITRKINGGTLTCCDGKSFISLNHQNHRIQENHKQNGHTENFGLCQLIDEHSKLASVLKGLWNMLMVSSFHNQSFFLSPQNLQRAKSSTEVVLTCSCVGGHFENNGRERN